tara:strand:+ start:4896 stop:6611 length:1716 start_codon:yes stop_codon:yes gene_type:complete
MDPRKILEYFKGREDYVALQQGKGFKPHKLNEVPLNVDKFEKTHLGQERCFGFYLMTPENNVYCSCLDFDDHADDPDPEWRAKATSYYYFLQERGLKPVMEVSSSGSGAHLWLFFSEPVPAVLVRSFWKKVAEKVDILIREIYPRQDKLTGEGMGNLVRYPGWNRSRFVEVEDDWTTAEFDPHPVFGCDLADIAMWMGESLSWSTPTSESFVSDRVAEILRWPDSLLARRWRGDTEGLKGDTSRSVLAFCLAREMIYQKIPEGEAKAALRQWCEEIGYRKSERWISLTFRKAYELMGKKEQKQDHHDLASCAELFLKRLGEHNHMGMGVQVVDQSIDGVSPGEVCIVAARPGHGKSTLALQWLDHQAKAGVPTLMLSAEMSLYELGRRMIQRLIGGDEESWKKDKEKTIRKVEKYFSGRARPFVRCVTSIVDIEKAIREYTQSQSVQLVAVDYLQLISGEKEGRYEEVSEISRRIKAAARDYNVGILALCQVNREVDRRDTVQFNLSDMKESGSIEQDADLILAGYWHGRGNKGGGEDLYELHCLKRRNGPIRMSKMEFRFDAEKQKFEDG